jgi:hypothetical protein
MNKVHDNKIIQKQNLSVPACIYNDKSHGIQSFWQFYHRFYKKGKVANYKNKCI